MLKLRSIFVTSLLTGLVITSNLGCGGSSSSSTDATDTPKTDVKADAVEVKPETTSEVASEVKPDAATDADAAKTDADAASDADAAKTDADAAPSDVPEVKADAVDATDANETGDTIPTCTPACTLGAKQCGTGGVQTCVPVNGCAGWSTAVACVGHTECTGAGNCTCVATADACTAVGTFCGSDGKLNTCAKDGNCLFVSATAACPTDTSCKGTAPASACTCDNTCDTVGSFCQDAKTAATCSADGNTPACRTVTATTACGTIKVCTGGACVCPAANGAHENEGCNRDTDTNICDGSHILTCVRDTDSGCDIWKVAPNGLCETDNGGGLTCGKGPAGTGPAACQCPARTGGDVYADPNGGSSNTTGVYATGILSPAQCRLPTLTLAIAEANKAGSGVSRIVAVSAEAAVFSGEGFPLTVPPDVTLTTADATPTPANYTIRFNSGAATSAVSLKNNSVVTGFTIEAAGNTGATAILFPTDGSATVSTVAIAKGTQAFLHGITVGGSAKATLTAVTIDQTTGSAIDVNTSSTVAITGGMATGSVIGLNVLGGTVNASGFTADGNHTGVSISGSAAVVNFSGGAVSNSVSHGIAASSGVLTLGPASNVIGNGGDGLSLSGGSITIHGGKIGMPKAGSVDQSNTNGINAAGGGETVNLTVDQGSTIDSNRQNGIVGGTKTLLTINGGTEILSNVGNGVVLAGALTNISSVSIHDNKMNGIDINSDKTVINIGNGTATQTTINNNTLNGILVEAALKTPSDANSVTLDGITASSNGSSGIFVAGTTGDASVTIKGSSVSSNGDTGVLVEEQGTNKTTTVFQNNDVFGNKTSSATHSVGGVLFNTSSTLPTFVGNKVHSNVGDELGFNDVPDAPAVKWIISPPSAACDSTANQLYCHGDGNVGLRVTGPALVDAGYVHWSNLPPAGNVDYSPFRAPPAPAQVDVSNACSVAACP